MAARREGFASVYIGAIIGCLLLLAPLTVHATSSSNYQIQEDFVGGGGGPASSSDSYQAQDAASANAVGGGNGTDFKAQSGPVTTNDPTLTFSVTDSTVNLGSLSTSITRTDTATFKVLNYTSYGYIVQIIGSPPDNGAHTLTAMSSATASSAGTEQFGVNLVANTSPTSFGADPLQVPSSSFSFGQAANGYDTTNTYKYVSGNTIAKSTQSSGETDYTIAYIANIANNTPGGSYSGSQTLVCTGTY